MLEDVLVSAMSRQSVSNHRVRETTVIEEKDAGQVNSKGRKHHQIGLKGPISKVEME